MVSTVLRYDAATLGQAQRTPQGFLRVPARLTRTGVLVYRRADGSERRELRRPEQVFAPESLATLADAPVTDLHPGMVTPDNVQQLSRGHVRHSSVRADGSYVAAELVITDGKMIAAVESRTRREVSCGYQCKLLEQPGVWNGERYDAEQTHIVYNHAGLGPEKWGRAGSECAVRLDGDAALVIDADDPERQPEPPKHKKGGTPMDLVTLKIDGIDTQVPTQAQQLITQALSKRDERIAELNKDATANKARLDALQGELDGTKTKLTEATDPKRLDAAITERVALLDKARPVLGADFKFDGMSARAIKEAVIAKLDAAAKFDGKSDEYVQGRFDSLSLTAADGGGGDPLSQARRATTPLPKPKQERADGAASIKDALPAWRQPLTVHRQ